jgi:hypothetical protein
VVLHLRTGPEVRLGPPTQVAVKVRAALAVLQASAGTPVAYVDVSVPTNPVAGGAGCEKWGVDHRMGQE